MSGYAKKSERRTARMQYERKQLFRTKRDRELDEIEEAMLPLKQRPCPACDGSGGLDAWPCEACKGFRTAGQALYQFRKLDQFWRDKPSPVYPDDAFVDDGERMRFEAWTQRHTPNIPR